MRSSMSSSDRWPPSILGGDPFNQFRYLYPQELWWKLHDEEYGLSVMRTAFEAGGRAFDLSFEVNARLFRRLMEEAGEPLIGFGNPTWEQGVFLNGRFLQYSRDRILHTLVEGLFPRCLARLVEERLSRRDVLVFGYDRQAALLSDAEIAGIALDEGAFRRRLSLFRDCRYLLLGGSDADWLVSLGRLDVVADLVRVARAEGFLPLLLCHYATLVVPQAGGALSQDVRGALDWLYGEVGVESILFGAATAAHARETTRLAHEARDAADARRTASRRGHPDGPAG